MNSREFLILIILLILGLLINRCAQLHSYRVEPKVITFAPKVEERAGEAEGEDVEEGEDAYLPSWWEELGEELETALDKMEQGLETATDELERVLDEWGEKWEELESRRDGEDLEAAAPAERQLVYSLAHKEDQEIVLDVLSPPYPLILEFSTEASEELIIFSRNGLPQVVGEPSLTARERRISLFFPPLPSGSSPEYRLVLPLSIQKVRLSPPFQLSIWWEEEEGENRLVLQMFDDQLEGRRQGEEVMLMGESWKLVLPHLKVAVRFLNAQGELLYELTHEFQGGFQVANVITNQGPTGEMEEAYETT